MAKEHLQQMFLKYLILKRCLHVINILQNNLDKQKNNHDLCIYKMIRDTSHFFSESVCCRLLDRSQWWQLLHNAALIRFTHYNYNLHLRQKADPPNTIIHTTS